MLTISKASRFNTTMTYLLVLAFTISCGEVANNHEVKNVGSNANADDPKAQQDAPNPEASLAAAACTTRVEVRTTTVRVVDETDLGTEDNGNWDVYEGTPGNPPNREVWIGTGGTVGQSFTGFRFRNLKIPANAQFRSAQLTFNHSATFAATGQWISIHFHLYGESAAAPAPYSIGLGPLPSARARTTANLDFAGPGPNSDFHWLPGTTWDLDVSAPVGELFAQGFARDDVSLISAGASNGQWGRMFLQNFGPGAAALTIEYSVTITVCPPPPGGGGGRCYTCTDDKGNRQKGMGCQHKETCTPGDQYCPDPNKDACDSGYHANACIDC